MVDVDVRFKCRAHDCDHYFDLANALASNRHFRILVCPSCGRLHEVLNSSGYAGIGLLNFDSFQIEIITLLDNEAATIPAPLREIIREAIRCYASGSDYACVAMCRRGVEAITVLKNAKGRTLKQKIDNLGNAALIDERSVYHDHYVRSLGNIACHFDGLPESAIGEQEAVACLTALWEVAIDVFLGPQPERRARCL